MKKLLLFGAALGLFLSGKAQVVTENAVIIDHAEDTTQVNTINDIIVMQEMVNTRNATDAHIANIWSRKSYFNPGLIVSSKLSSKDPVYLKNGKREDLSFKSDWGAQIQLGHSYTLHKGAIANMVQINLDYTFIDLTVNKYSEDKTIYDLYDPDDKWGTNPGTPAEESPTATDRFSYLPWGAEKFDATYGMSLGPSVAIAPFTMMDSSGLHFIKLNAYFHWGYNVGFLLMNHKDDDSKKGLSIDYLSWGHGSSTTFGLNLSWKSIGIGWETRTANLKYKPLSTEEYGDRLTKFKNSTSRIYLTIKY